MMFYISVVILLAVLVGFIILYRAVYKLQKIIKYGDLVDVCHYLNYNKVYVRDKNCKTFKYRAHIVRDHDEDVIMIDLL